MSRLRLALALSAALALAACATRSGDVAPAPASAAEFAHWSCPRLEAEMESVQRRAADVAYAVDERSGNNVIALGVGLAVFWPALLAMRPVGPEADDLARLKGRFEALQLVAHKQSCPPLTPELSPERLAVLPVAVNERLVYEDRTAKSRTGTGTEWTLRVVALRRDEVEYLVESEPAGTLRQDRIGNVMQAPAGVLRWPQLLRGELELGQVVAGDIAISGDSLARIRVRGQVVAVGPQTVAGRRFDVVVVELFGDAQRGEEFSRLDGALVVDRATGVLLRLDLRTALTGLALQRRLVRVEPAH